MGQDQRPKGVLYTKKDAVAECQYYVINVDTTLNPVTIVLLNPTHAGLTNGNWSWVLNDVGNNAATNNITLVASGCTINGGATMVLNKNGIQAQIVPTSASEYLVNLSGDTGGGGGGSVNSVNGIYVNNTDPVNPVLAMVQDTYANWSAKQIAGTLPTGSWIRITDASDTDLGATLFCESAISVNNYGGGGFLNADIQGVGNYTGVPALTFLAVGKLKGVWQAANEVIYANGDMVIYNTLHYQVFNSMAFNGTNPQANPSAYIQLLRGAGANLGYIEEWCRIQFNFAQDGVITRYDTRGNVVPTSSLFIFQFGDDGIVNCALEAGAVINNLNNIGAITNCSYGANCGVVHTNNAGGVDSCVFGAGIDITLVLNNKKAHSNCVYTNSISSFAFDSNVSYSEKELTNAYSTFDLDVDAQANYTPIGNTLTLDATKNYVGINRLTTEVQGTILASVNVGALTVGETVTFTDGTNTYTAKVFLTGATGATFVVTELSGVIDNTYTYIGGTSGHTGTVGSLVGGFISNIVNAPSGFPYRLYCDNGVLNPILTNVFLVASANNIVIPTLFLLAYKATGATQVGMLVGGADINFSNAANLINETGAGLNKFIGFL